MSDPEQVPGPGATDAPDAAEARSAEQALPGSQAPASALRFEAALARLEAIVGELDGGELDLEDSLAKFEEGVHLARLCHERVRSAELRLKTLEEQVDGFHERPLDLDEGA